jgi:hypothetical protein
MHRHARQQQEAMPDTDLPRAHEAIVPGRAGTVPLGGVGRRNAGAQPLEGPVENPTVTDTRHSPQLVRQQRLNDRPLIVRGQRRRVSRATAPTPRLRAMSRSRLN